ncbi:paired box' domain protein [Ancylostoma caninum]|uniref:Paired box' domain protein n=1 Tax=Ancylostoma caninum TaxID=29170 RepID=A0A368GX19_ANCCA|nr:paired box' domain protein [Ancylostoma caninum]
MTPLDALPYSQFLFYNELSRSVQDQMGLEGAQLFAQGGALDLTTSGFLPYSLVPPIAPPQFQAPHLLINESPDRNKQGRAYNPGRPLSMSDRERILRLYEKGHKISHIARIIGVTHSCVSKIMTRYRRTGSMYPRSYSTGVLASRQNSLDLAESSSDCSTSGNSEDWSSAQLLLKSSLQEEQQELVPKPPWNNSQGVEASARVATTSDAVTAEPPPPSRGKLSSYSIER